MLHIKVLIRELATIDAVAPSAIAALKVSTLDHKVLNDSMEGAALVTIALLTLGCKEGIARDTGDGCEVWM